MSRAANGRYLTALASVSGSTPLKAEANAVCQRVTAEGRHYRALNPWSEADGALLEAISRGEYIRNRDLL